MPSPDSHRALARCYDRAAIGLLVAAAPANPAAPVFRSFAARLRCEARVERGLAWIAEEHDAEGPLCW